MIFIDNRQEFIYEIIWEYTYIIVRGAGRGTRFKSTRVPRKPKASQGSHNRFPAPYFPVSFIVFLPFAYSMLMVLYIEHLMDHNVDNDISFGVKLVKYLVLYSTITEIFLATHIWQGGRTQISVQFQGFQAKSIDQAALQNLSFTSRIFYPFPSFSIIAKKEIWYYNFSILRTVKDIRCIID